MKAQETIEAKESDTLYKKVGRKYVAINDPCAYDGLREGYWLVKIASGSTSIRSCVYPAKAELQAAIRDKEDQLFDIIRKASEARPQRRPISEQAKADWELLVARNGKEFSTLEYPSIQENAENIIKILLEK